MASGLSPGLHATTTLSDHMSPAQLTRRTSRSSTSQSGYRSSRVEKPRSNHNSPGTLERRKTTVGTKRYATLDDHYNMMFGFPSQEEAVEEQKESSWPLTWHPSSAQFHVPGRSSIVIEPPQEQNWTRHYSTSSRNSMQGSDIHSLSTRNSMFSEHRQHQPTSADSYSGHRRSQDSDSSWRDTSRQTQGPASSTPTAEPLPWYLQEWTRKNREQVAASRHGSSDFLPIQHPSAEGDEEDAEHEDDDDMEDAGKELIGMGLYDLPDNSMAWTSDLDESTGKGLKLEETWQPAPEEEDDEDDEEEQEDDASSDDESVEEPAPPAKDNVHLPLQHAVATTPLHSNMEGQSFFFDEEDETYTKEWWFQQLKQPSLPVRDAGLGYGWL